MTTDDQARSASDLEATLRNAASRAVAAEAMRSAPTAPRLTVEHGQPLDQHAAELLRQLIDDVDQAVAAAGYLGGGTVTRRLTSTTWTFLSIDVPARQLLRAARLVANRLDPGSWIVTADERPERDPAQISHLLT